MQEYRTQMAPRGKIGLTKAQTMALAEWARNNAYE